MKKIVSILVCFVFIFTFALPSFAATDINATLRAFIHDDSSADTYIGKFDYMGMTSEQKLLYKEFMNAFTGYSLDANYQYAAVLTSNALQFYRIPANVSFGARKNTSSRYCLTIPVNTVYSMLDFSATKKNAAGEFTVYNFQINRTHSSVVQLGSDYGLLIAASSNIKTDSSVTQTVVSDITPTVKGNALFVDNEPTPDPSPTPAPPVTPPKEPEIPAGNTEFVPYDTAIWKSFLSHIKGNIGSATNIGLLIFAVIMGILIMIAIVKKFSKGK